MKLYSFSMYSVMVEVNLIFIIPCIVIYSYCTTNKTHLLSQIIYSCKTFYMFRTVFPSIIRSLKLRIQQRYLSNKRCHLLLAEMKWNSFRIAADSSTCLTYTVAVYAFLSSWWWTEMRWNSSSIAAGSSSCLTYTVAVCAVLSSRWWTERPSETCRAFYKNKQFVITGLYCWLYYRDSWDLSLITDIHMKTK
jgi:hypothetical protein